jgi:Glypican
MKELKPFGDVPDKLSVQVKRSFVATRTFVQALSAAAEVARNMMQIRPVNDCITALTKMSTCGSCMGYAEKPCEPYCVNVMKSCLHQYAELDVEWDNFVAQMEKVSDRLLGPFNIVMVVEPINIKISEAIMNFQVRRNVIIFCGQYSNGIIIMTRNPDRTSVNEFFLAAERRNLSVSDVQYPYLIQMLIYLLTTDRKRSFLKWHKAIAQRGLPIPEIKRTVAIEIIKKLTLNRLNFHATTTKEIGVEIAAETVIATISGTAMERPIAGNRH